MFFNTSPKSKIKHQARITPAVKLIIWLVNSSLLLAGLQLVSAVPHATSSVEDSNFWHDNATNNTSSLVLSLLNPWAIPAFNNVPSENFSVANDTGWNLSEAIMKNDSNLTLDFLDSRSRRDAQITPKISEAGAEIQSASFSPESMITDPGQLIDQQEGSALAPRQDHIEALVASEENPQDTNVGNPDTSENLNKGTMVLVTSKSGQFKEIVPLEDLIVTRAPEFARTATTTESQQPGLDNMPQNDGEVAQEDHTTRRPSLAELIAAGTAMGLQMSDLARASSSIHQDRLIRDGGIDRGESRNIDLSTREPQQETAMEHEVTERVPESIESLVRSSEQDDLAEPIDENDHSASNVVTDEDDDRRAPKKLRAMSGRLPARRLISGPDRRRRPKAERDGDGDSEDENDRGFDEESRLDKSSDGHYNRRPASQVAQRGSDEDLKTAAGHYYGKKKKKKIKKKKIVKVKKKKVKKYKVKKYKKVKIIKKKKKKKKVKKYHHHHHHHGHYGGHGHGGHDHGKYYMYAKVPKKKSWEFGFKRGNKKHWIERHEKGHKNKFKTKVKWYDKKSKGKGIHIWDYNHFDKKKHHG